MNPGLVVLLPVITYLVVTKSIELIKTGSIQIVDIRWRGYKWCLMVFLFWFIARNIPHPAFEWTRPTPDTLFDR